MKYNVLSIIEPSEVRLIAFAGVAGLPDEVVSATNIEYAISRYIEPVMGHKLLERVSKGEYEQLKKCYLQGVVAQYVRYVSGYDAQSEAACVLARARQMLGELSSHLESNRALYPEYDGAKNTLNRCKIHGNMVQIL